MSITIAEALNVQNRTVSSRDAEVLLSTALGKERAFLHSHGETELSPTEQQTYEDFLRRREQNEPVAYITGSKEFYGRLFKCDARALIVRPETEGVVEQALAWLGNKAAKVLELGTGAGNIATTLSLESPALTITATDISGEALELAQENARTLGATVTFAQSDLFETVTGTFDLIVANLPYVETTWQQNPAAQQDVLFYEPDVALFGGEDGLDLYRRFFTEAPNYLTEGGAVIIEYGETQTSAISALARSAFPGHTLIIHQDYAGLDRVLTLT